MKRTIITICIVCMMSSCGTDKKNSSKKSENKRIHGKESIVIDGIYYSIIEVDGIEYITSGTGGIYPLVK